MNPYLGAIAVLTVAAIRVSGRVFDPLLERCGKRLANWFLPDDRVWTYRIALGLARTAYFVAVNKAYRAGAAAQGALADIDDVRLGSTCSARVSLGLGFSVLRLALVERLAYLLLIAMGPIPYLYLMNSWAVALGGQPDHELGIGAPKTPLRAVGVLLGSNVAFAAALEFSPNTILTILVVVVTWPIWSVDVLMLVHPPLDIFFNWRRTASPQPQLVWPDQFRESSEARFGSETDRAIERQRADAAM